MSKKIQDYDIGYGKPPKQFQFRKGTSGNSKGRPPKSRNAGKVLQEKLFERVTITQNGKRMRVTFLEAIIMRLRQKAVEGDSRTLDQLIRLLPIMERSMETEGDTPWARHADQDDYRILQNFLATYGNAPESGAE